jgi:triacylglycerol esterase/lipase EstA (alpha/beta hydrolase family)
MPRILYIHGANATAKSFNHIKSRLPHHIASDFEYSAHVPLEDVINQAADHLDEPTHIVAHSLGGIIAVALSQRYKDKVHTVTTMSTPFGGSEAATRASVFLPFDTFLQNVNIRNPTLNEIIHTGRTVSTMNIVTTAGHNSFELQPNDGVVTIDSQKAFACSMRCFLDVNHFEVLLSQRTVDLIEDHVWLHNI